MLSRSYNSYTKSLAWCHYQCFALLFSILLIFLYLFIFLFLFLLFHFLAILLVILPQILNLTHDSPGRILFPSQQKVNPILDLLLIYNFIEIHHIHSQLIMLQILTVLYCWFELREEIAVLGHQSVPIAEHLDETMILYNNVTLCWILIFVALLWLLRLRWWDRYRLRWLVSICCLLNWKILLELGCITRCNLISNSLSSFCPFSWDVWPRCPTSHPPA